MYFSKGFGGRHKKANRIKIILGEGIQMWNISFPGFIMPQFKINIPITIGT
jgi:hypothetical protein